MGKIHLEERAETEGAEEGEVASLQRGFCLN